jgi:hypothetical protein
MHPEVHGIGRKSWLAASTAFHFESANPTFKRQCTYTLVMFMESPGEMQNTGYHAFGKPMAGKAQESVYVR